MTWPEDEIDFEDDADFHTPLVGDALTAAELDALAAPPDVVVQGGRTQTVRVKKPCGGSIPPEKAKKAVVHFGSVELVELRERQDKLATAVEIALTHLTARMDVVENKGTPFWIMTDSQKNVLIMSGATLFFLVIMGCLSVAFRVVGIPI